VEQIVERLSSRKFWMALLGALMSLLLPVLTSEIPWDVALPSAITVIVSYILGQGYVDAKEAEGVAAALASNPTIGEADPGAVVE